MAIVEDAASVLEQFVQDVANLPAEIAHLLEEIEAKDRVIQDCRHTINARDTSIQKFQKLNGISQPNPKEDAYTKTILSNYDKAHLIQDEKVALTEKASTLLDRQIRRLDIKIRDLLTEGAIPPDPSLPSLLHPSNPRASTSSHVLHPITGNAPPSTTIANSALARLVPPPTTTPIPHPASAPLRTRESSLTATTPTLSIDPNKRRRLNLPAPGSSLRQSSLGPGTPRTGTPSVVRGGSAGPGRAAVPKKAGASISGSSGAGASKKVAPHQRVNSLLPNAKKLSSSAARRRAKKAGGNGMKPSPSSTGEDSALSDDSASNPNSSAQPSTISLAHPTNAHSHEDVDMGGDPFAADAEDGDDQSDDQKYCTCRSVSYGNMVACDNEECAYEWFHWSCVGITKEPAGKWFCGECRVKLGI